MKEAENQIIVYEPNETIRLDVRLEKETVWLNRHQMSQLFGRDIKQSVSILLMRYQKSLRAIRQPLIIIMRRHNFLIIQLSQNLRQFKKKGIARLFAKLNIIV